MKLLLILLFSGISLNLQAEIKFAVVDLKRALHEVEDGKKAKTQLEKEFNAKKAKLDKKQKELQDMRKGFEKKAAVLSQEARMKEGQKMEEEFQKYRELLTTSQADMQKRETEVTNPILKGLEDELKKIAKDKEYAVVLEKGQAAVVFNKEELDITDELIKKYNSRK